MPTGRPNNKKNKKKQQHAARAQRLQSSEAAVTCAFCAKPVPKQSKNRIECICTRVVYCSEACQRQTVSTASAGKSRHVCPGPPDAVEELGQRLKQAQDTGLLEGFLTGTGAQESAWLEENKRTVAEPAMTDIINLLKHEISNDAVLDKISSDITAAEYSSYADRGSVACAYMAGVRYKQRMFGKMKLSHDSGGGGQAIRGLMNRKVQGSTETMSALKADELAVRYFSIAADAGHGFAMQSLAACYEKGTGIGKNMRACREWLWRATLQGSAGAREMLHDKCILPMQLTLQQESLKQIAMYAAGQFPPGHPIGTWGANLASLVISLWKPLKEHNFTLPPFAATVPTVGISVSEGNNNDKATNQVKKRLPAGPMNIVGMEEMIKIVAEMEKIIRVYEVHCIYGRWGTAKQTTAVTLGEAERSLDCQLFQVPPAPICDETVSDQDAARWIEKLNSPSASRATGDTTSVKFFCVHLHVKSQEQPVLICSECIEDARERLAVVSTGSVALSIDEALLSRGHTVIWRRPGSSELKSERFSAYSRAEAECTLASLVLAQYGWNGSLQGDLAHPLFVAQDPNFFWPLIFDHGSIRAALEYVAPHIDWNDKLGPIKKASDQVPVVTFDSDPQPSPGSYLQKCGSDVCCNLQRDQMEEFGKCPQCLRRSYCSDTCQKIDWKFHKSECKSATAGGTFEPKAAEPEKEKKRTYEDTGPELNEEVVIHGLVAKPEYNGLIGVVRGPILDGRYPVKLLADETKVASKPANLYRLGIFVSLHKKKAVQFECFRHGAEVCRRCSFDFELANHLAKLKHIYKEQSKGEEVTVQMIEQIAENHFAPIKREDRSYRMVDQLKEWPMACMGIKDLERRFVFRALLNFGGDRKAVDPKLSLRMAAAIAGLATYAARSESIIRPIAVSHAETLIGMI